MRFHVIHYLKRDYIGVVLVSLVKLFCPKIYWGFDLMIKSNFQGVNTVLLTSILKVIVKKVLNAST